MTEATYLGVIFDARLTWESQFYMMTANAYKSLNMFTPRSSDVPHYPKLHDMIDITGSMFIKQHLILNAKHRMQIMTKNSPTANKVIQEYSMLRHVQENSPPLDVIVHIQ